ncbi:hypothetical protein Ancab_001130 [Ancistrocladus abbreviatus]
MRAVPRKRCSADMKVGRSALHSLAGDCTAFEYASERDIGGRGVNMDVDVAEVFVGIGEDFLPENGEGKEGVGKEEEGDFGFWIGGAEAEEGVCSGGGGRRRGGRVLGLRAHRRAREI